MRKSIDFDNYTLIREYNDHGKLKTVKLLDPSGGLRDLTVNNNGQSFKINGWTIIDHSIGVGFSDSITNYLIVAHLRRALNLEDNKQHVEYKRGYDDGFRAGIQKATEVVKHIPFDPKDKRLVREDSKY